MTVHDCPLLEKIIPRSRRLFPTRQAPIFPLTVVAGGLFGSHFAERGEVSRRISTTSLLKTSSALFYSTATAVTVNQPALPLHAPLSSRLLRSPLSR